MVNVLVVGSGGREHALSWKLSQSEKVDKVFTAPGNGGTKNNISINVDGLDKLANFAKENRCFTVVGPEVPLSAGIVDNFIQMGLKIFGPTQKAAQLESSKIWAKEFMKRNQIPSARFEIFNDPKKAEDYVQSIDYEVVVKADGLAAGKGVIVCNSKEEAISAIDTILVKKTYGEAGNRIIIEERIDEHHTLHYLMELLQSRWQQAKIINEFLMMIKVQTLEGWVRILQLQLLMML
jgi:phosphoribosylamine--glycine ligase